VSDWRRETLEERILEGTFAGPGLDGYLPTYPLIYSAGMRQAWADVGEVIYIRVYLRYYSQA
jgi:hypothetical protein